MRRKCDQKRANLKHFRPFLDREQSGGLPRSMARSKGRFLLFRMAVMTYLHVYRKAHKMSKSGTRCSHAHWLRKARDPSARSRWPPGRRRNFRPGCPGNELAFARASHAFVFARPFPPTSVVCSRCWRLLPLGNSGLSCALFSVIFASLTSVSA